MKGRFLKMALCGASLGLVLAGCATKPYDYTNYRAHPPRSILVLPPLNESTAVEGTYSYLSTVTMPIAEMGYYVFPVAVVDRFFKENGLPTPGEMHQAPLSKIREIFGADAVLYVTLKQYGTKYQVISSVTAVTAHAKLVDSRTETLLWEGFASAQDSSGGSGNIIGDLVAAVITQAVNKSTDHAHQVSRAANARFAVKDHGLLYGPYHPKYGTQ
jgi:hypothetical protein